jgi:hypothetical protein
MMDTRPSPIAGRWYPGEAGALTRAVEGYLRAARESPETFSGNILGLLTPHAGLMYSGPVAGYAFEAIHGLAVEVVAVLCPSHFHPDAAVLTSGHEAYATPLGSVPVDHQALARLREALLKEEVSFTSIRRDQEHAIEIELPFLQNVLAPGWRLIPLMLRDQSERAAHALGRALAAILKDQRALVIASSDLSHYQSQRVAVAMDTEMLKQVEAFDPGGVLRAQAEERGFACGVGALAATLWATRELGATYAKVVRHATSGDVSGDYETVVGYGAAVFWKA